ncbi:Neurotransmitter-gated ion-channel ligand-binding domain [Trinorchestia longiramus]|nr:Neurotransmitter-gated ion-channel ligand-binding domain [Trinorchestia longiramus]
MNAHRYKERERERERERQREREKERERKREMEIHIVVSHVVQVCAGSSGSSSQSSGFPFGGNADKRYKSDQHKLFEDLFRHYVKDIRPVLSHGDIIDITFEIALFNVLELNAKRGEMTTNVEVILRWIDPMLTWDPALYNDTTILRVPHYNIWEPDIILYNSAARDYSSSIISTNAIIWHTGRVTVLLQAIFVSTCRINIEWYPFDQQVCDLLFGSRTADLLQVSISPGASDISRYEPNHEFVLENFYSDMDEIMDPCCDHPFALVTYHVQLQRRVKFPLFFFIMPGILINICAVLVFSLPAESGEKVGLGINAMLAMMVFLMAMINNLPPAESIPLAGMYYGVCLAVITANIGLSVYVMNLSHGGERGHKLPVRLQRITKVLARTLRIEVHPMVQQLWKTELEQKATEVDQTDPASLTSSSGIAWPVFKVRPTPTSKSTSTDDVTRLSQELNSTPPVTSDVNVIIEEWKLASRALDRFLFYLFGVITVLFNAILLTSSPYGVKVQYCDENGECHSSEHDVGKEILFDRR